MPVRRAVCCFWPAIVLVPKNVSQLQFAMDMRCCSGDVVGGSCKKNVDAREVVGRLAGK